jgi:hypothetical protein
MVVLMAACAVFHNAGNMATDNGANQPPAVRPKETVKSPMEEQQSSGHWITGQRDNQFIIIGISGRLSRPNDEIEAAKKDAARKAAMFHGVQGSVEHINSGSGNFFDYVANSKLELNYDTNYEPYIERLSFNPETDVIRGPGAVFVRMKYNAANSVPVNYAAKKNNGRPTWINSRDLPEIPDYTVAVGYAGRRSRFTDTVNASCDSAAARLIESASTQVETRVNSIAGQSSSAAVYVHSEGRLSNFQIIEFWIDPDNGSVSTLAIARVFK